MGVKTINNLTETTTTGDTDNIPIVDNSGSPSTKRITIANLKGSVNGIISITPNIDLMQLGDNLIYTVPAGKTLIVTNLIVVNTNGDCTTAAHANIGFTNPDYNDVFDNVTISSKTTNKVLNMGLGTGASYGLGSINIVPAESNVYFKVTTAASNGSVNIGTICLAGFLI